MEEYRRDNRSSTWKYVAIGTILIGVVTLLVVLAPNIRAGFNKLEYAIQKADDATNYETLKKVEDTCRAYIASYEADKITYETLKNETDEVSIETAWSAKIRANRTAATYNTYYLENKYVWKDNVPSDIRYELPRIE